MGRFLCIGFNTTIEVNRAELQRCSSGEDNARAIIEKHLANRELYDLTITDDLLIYFLKEDIAKKEWCAFIKDFYDMRYRVSGERMEDEEALEAISAYTTLEDWLSIARKKRYECYQMETHQEYIGIDSFYSCPARVQSIILSLDGTIIMECYNSLFRFLTTCIKKRLEQYKLSCALRVYISG